MEERGEIFVIKTKGGHRRYNVKDFVKRHAGRPAEASDRVKLCYCRVSSRGQKDDLERQVVYMQEKYPTYKIIKDVGSGLNFKREGLKTILDLACSGKLEEVVVAYKDRLCRFGYDLVEYVLKQQSNARIVVLNDISLSPEEELTKDLLQILTVFGARLHGLRKYKSNIKKDKDLSKSNTEENTETVDGSV